MQITIRVPGEPVPQNQGKVGRWRSKDGREGVTIRQPARVRNYKVELQERMGRAAMDAGLPPSGSTTLFGDRPVSLEILAVFELPVSRHRKRQPVSRQWHTGRYGNCDNLTKAIGDAGEAVLWQDDGQIAELVVHKVWGAQGEAPYVEIRVREMHENPTMELVSHVVGTLALGPPLNSLQGGDLEEER